MPQNKENLSANDAWKAIIEKYHILEHIEKDGCFPIKASQIKEFREPRLMAKWDSTDALPEVLRKIRSTFCRTAAVPMYWGTFFCIRRFRRLTNRLQGWSMWSFLIMNPLT